ncbi:tropomyosin-like, partial [Hippocampus comes]|uniref:tropomyosin-like n=1 Tax=Hippocampus comes TaxID=109280 RepID=UPI00094EE5C3
MSLYHVLSLIAPRLSEEKAAALQQCEESIAEKAEETTKIKLQLEETQQELLLAKNQISSMDQLLKAQEQFGAELQKQSKKMSEREDEYKRMDAENTQKLLQMEEELREARAQLEEKERLLGEERARLLSLEKQNEGLEKDVQETVKETELLKDTHTEKVNKLQEQISYLEEEVSASKDSAEKLSLLKRELEVINRSHADLKNHADTFEKTLSSMTEVKTNLEKSLSERVILNSALEKEVAELREKVSQLSESQALEAQSFLNKEKSLREEREAAEKALNAIKAETSNVRAEVKTMKVTLSAASQGLEERDTSIKSLKEKLSRAEVEHAKTAELLKEKMLAMNKIKVWFFAISPYDVYHH